MDTEPIERTADAIDPAIDGWGWFLPEQCLKAQGAAATTKEADGFAVRDVAKLFSQDQLEAIAGALGDTDTRLPERTEIATLISTCEMTDPGEMTKQRRIYNAFAASHNARQDRTRILGFIRPAMSPARYSREPHRHEPTPDFSRLGKPRTTSSRVVQRPPGPRAPEQHLVPFIGACAGEDQGLPARLQ